MGSLTKVKRMLDITDDDFTYDNVILLLLEKNEIWVRGYCCIDEEEAICGELVNVVEDLCVAAYNRLGSEGFTSENVGSVRITYTALSDIAKDVLIRYKQVKF